MSRRALLFAFLLLSLAALLFAGCGDSSGKSEPISEPDTTVEDTGSSTDVETDTTQTTTPTGPSRAAVVSGAGQRESDNYKLNITVGGPVSSPTLESDQYKLRLGVGAGR